MRKNPIERAEKFHLGKGDKCRRGPLIKSSCFTVIFFRALSLTLPFHYLCSSREKKISTIVFSCHIFFSHFFSIFVRRETEKKSAQNFFLGQSPCSCWSEKRVHGCQIALKTPWKIDLQHFSGPWHYLEGSWIGNLWAGDGIKMSSLLEKKENCPFSPSPSSPKNRQERKKHRGLRLWRRKGPYILI